MAAVAPVLTERERQEKVLSEMIGRPGTYLPPQAASAAAGAVQQRMYFTIEGWSHSTPAAVSRRGGNSAGTAHAATNLTFNVTEYEEGKPPRQGRFTYAQMRKRLCATDTDMMMSVLADFFDNYGVGTARDQQIPLLRAHRARGDRHQSGASLRNAQRFYDCWDRMIAAVDTATGNAASTIPIAWRLVAAFCSSAAPDELSADDADRAIAATWVARLADFSAFNMPLAACGEDAGASVDFGELDEFITAKGFCSLTLDQMKVVFVSLAPPAADGGGRVKPQRMKSGNVVPGPPTSARSSFRRSSSTDCERVQRRVATSHRSCGIVRAGRAAVPRAQSGRRRAIMCSARSRSCDRRVERRAKNSFSRGSASCADSRAAAAIGRGFAAWAARSSRLAP